jgi:hypothetical protein
VRICHDPIALYDKTGPDAAFESSGIPWCFVIGINGRRGDPD